MYVYTSIKKKKKGRLALPSTSNNSSILGHSKNKFPNFWVWKTELVTSFWLTQFLVVGLVLKTIIIRKKLIYIYIYIYIYISEKSYDVIVSKLFFNNFLIFILQVLWTERVVNHSITEKEKRKKERLSWDCLLWVSNIFINYFLCMHASIQRIMQPIVLFWR